eukprot:1014031-Prymnesium_polylepis.1
MEEQAAPRSTTKRHAATRKEQRHETGRPQSGQPIAERGAPAAPKHGWSAPRSSVSASATRDVSSPLRADLTGAGQPVGTRSASALPDNHLVSWL